MQNIFTYSGILLSIMLCSCSNTEQRSTSQVQEEQIKKDTISSDATKKVMLPKPYETKSSTKFSKVIGWPEGKTPVAPEGFEVSKFAEGLQNPRWIYVAPNGDIFVSEATKESKGLKKIGENMVGKTASENKNKNGSANRITIFRDADANGSPEIQDVFLEGLHMPFGMLVLGNYFYVANSDGLWRYPYKEGDTKMMAKGKKILDLPAGGYNNHWTRNLIASADGSKIYVTVGSGSNVGENGMEHEVRRACILEINPDGTGEKIYASGLRNPVGVDWNPVTKELWTAVNERDKLGDDLVPDYITSVKEGGFYGWPYSYFGDHEDPSFEGEKRPDLIAKALVPDVPVGSHTASLGLAFYDQKAFPKKYHNGAFVGQHGSWNRSELTGYKVLFVPFENGKPSVAQEDFLSGFIADIDKNEVYGRPVCVTVLSNGAMLVSDDAGNTIWYVTVKK